MCMRLFINAMPVNGYISVSVNVADTLSHSVSTLAQQWQHSLVIVNNGIAQYNEYSGCFDRVIRHYCLRRQFRVRGNW